MTNIDKNLFPTSLIVCPPFIPPSSLRLPSLRPSLSKLYNDCIVTGQGQNSVNTYN